MVQRRALLSFLAAAFIASARPALAQPPVFGVSLQHAIEQYSDDASLNRLDGNAIGMAVFGGISRGPFLVRLEGAFGRPIDDRRVTTIETNGRTVTIESTLAHHAHALSALGGYTHQVSSRLRLAYLGGVSLTRVSRAFSSNAGDVLLVQPSTRGSSTTRTVDRFSTLSAGADLFVRTRGRMHLMAGVRFEPMRLREDIDGYRVRSLAGVAWTWR
jgi:hypothetical protein